jgi:hypothetical protein
MARQRTLFLAGACGLLAIFCIAAAIGISGANRTPTGEDAGRRIFVAPTTVQCGREPQTCLLVRHREELPWVTYQGHIEGFTYEPGYHYELIVDLDGGLHPIIDDPQSRVHLIRVVSKTPAP